MRVIFLAIIVFIRAAAQQVVAPTPEQVGPARGENSGNYNIVNSFETGYRFSLIDGNLGKYRSDVNYRNGPRLLGSNLTINSRDGHGHYFDEIVLNTIGLGNDPYQSAVLRVQKNRLYQYDMSWRLNEYYNPGLAFSAGEHLMDTRRRLQDHDLTLFPESRFRLFLGYSRNSQTGPALSTIQLFDNRGDEFPVFQNVARLRNTYRLGGDARLFGFKLTVLHFWDDFKEDTPFGLDGSTLGNNPGDRTTLTQFRRTEPYHGTSPGWFANLSRDSKLWAANARFTYVGGQRDFILDETAIGTNRFGAAQNRQIVIGGDARRPVSSGDLTLSFFPADKVTITNQTSFHNTRIDGNSVYTQFDNSSLSSNNIQFNFLGIRAITNSTDANYRFSKWLGFSAGYHYTTRRIRTIEGFALPGSEAESQLYEQQNHLHAGTFAVQLRPLKPLSIRVDTEIGRADRPFTPISDRNYHIIGGRVDYRTRTLTLSTAYRQNYNVNSVNISTFSSRARNYSANASWSPREWFGIDAGYMKLHLDTVGGIAFFAGAPESQLIQGRDSIYISNIHSGNIGARFVVNKRVDLYAGYSITKDAGDGRGRAAPAGITDPVSLVFVPVQTFPLSFHSPLARVSVRLHSKLRWNVGWQFYRYREEFGLFSQFQNYRAHTGYSSLLWSF